MHDTYCLRPAPARLKREIPSGSVAPVDIADKRRLRIAGTGSSVSGLSTSGGRAILDLVAARSRDQFGVSARQYQHCLTDPFMGCKTNRSETLPGRRLWPKFSAKSSAALSGFLSNSRINIRHPKSILCQTER